MEMMDQAERKNSSSVVRSVYISCKILLPYLYGQGKQNEYKDGERTALEPLARLLPHKFFLPSIPVNCFTFRLDRETAYCSMELYPSG